MAEAMDLKSIQCGFESHRGYGLVAQWLEHTTHNRLVVGSNPTQPICLMKGNKMKIFRIEVDVISRAFETAHVYIEAESLDEAKKKFEDDPFDHDWDDWETHDSETVSWEMCNERCAYDEYMTKHIKTSRALKKYAQTKAMNNEK
jgi:hypothetical protein